MVSLPAFKVAFALSALRVVSMDSRGKKHITGVVRV